jgi:cell division protein FtsL
MNADGWAVLLLVAVIISAVGVAYSNHVNRDLFVELQARQQERDELELEWGRLQLEQSTIADIAAIDHDARTRLRMAVPDHDDVIYLRP